jgi:hypothetical protein
MDEIKNRLESIIERINLFRTMKTDYFKDYIRDAHFYYQNYGIPEEYIYKALNLLSRFLYAIHPEWPKEKFGFFSAALYIVVHSPTYEGLEKYEKKSDFINRFNNVKLTSLEWYINKIEKSLDLYRIHDDKSRSFWLDDQTKESYIINGIIQEKLNNSNKLRQYPYYFLVEEVLELIMKKLELIPRQFRREFWQYISEKLEMNANFLDS